jgi:hypothetical protein
LVRETKQGATSIVNFGRQIRTIKTMFINNAPSYLNTTINALFLNNIKTRYAMF